MAVIVDAQRRTALLHGSTSTYALTWADDRMPLRHLHWGAPITDVASLLTVDDFPRPFGAVPRPRAAHEEYPCWGGLRREPMALKITMPDGVRSLDLAVDDWEADDASLRLTLRDHHYPCAVLLEYLLDADHDAIVRRATITNEGTDGDLRVDLAGSASWALPARPTWHLSTARGRYGAEFHVGRRELAQGTVELGSRHGITGHDALPWMAVDVDASVDHGEVWAFAFAWSGSWTMGAHLAEDGALHVIGGLDPTDLDLTVAPGESVTLPDMIGVHADDGFDGAARRFHAHARAHVVPDPDRPRPVLYNSWEASTFSITASQQCALADIAADMGVELFVVDDGWFHGRDDDTAGLGDWWPHERRFPAGLGPLVDHVHGLGMAFGLWIEPEMVNPDSELYRAHPDWIHRWATREPTLQRHQMVLDFSRDDVRDWAVDTVVGLCKAHGIDHIKWDMNRPIVEPAAPNGVHAHTRGVHEVWDRIREACPGLWLENCASGGGRADLGAAAHTHWTWTSDATDAVERIAIQHGFTRTHPSLAMAAWITDVPNVLTGRTTPLAFRAHVALSAGVLGLGMDLTTLDAQDRTFLAEVIALHKRLRPVLQFGHRRELPAPGEGISALAIGCPDEAVAFAFAARPRYGHGLPRLRLAGLEEEEHYRVTALPGAAGDASDGQCLSGAFLTHVGLPLTGVADHASWAYHLVRQT